MKTDLLFRFEVLCPAIDLAPKVDPRSPRRAKTTHWCGRLVCMREVDLNVYSKRNMSHERNIVWRSMRA